MLISDAFAAAAPPAGGDLATGVIGQIVPIVLIFVVFYFLLIRPQQKRLKAHQEMVAGVKRGDVVVTSGGLIGKVRTVQDDELRVELAPNVEVRVVRSTITDIKNRGEPTPANDSKPAKPDA